MQFLDFSPPSHPTLEQQKDALQKGLGRAFQWAQQGLVTEEILLEACLLDQRFDKQCEGNRGDFLWDIISVSGMEKRFRDPIFNAFCVETDNENTWQLCELAYYFAEAGDDGFRQQLYKIVGQRQTSDAPNLGEDQLLRLDGADALRFLTRLRGHNLANHDWDWDDSSVIRTAIELLGEQCVQAVLTESSDADVRRFASGWQANVKSANDPESQQTYQQKMEQTTVSDVLKAAHCEDRSLWLASWGKCARDHELELVFEQIWTEQDARVITKLLRVFSGRPMPTFDSRLLELCHHSDADVRRCAFIAVGQNSQPSVREFALKELSQRIFDRPVVKLLIKNFQRGDEQQLLD